MAARAKKNFWQSDLLTPSARECTIEIYIITQVILAFWLVLAYDLLEDRRTIDVFKMADSFENYDNILRDWAKDKVQKSLAEALNRFEKPESQK